MPTYHAYQSVCFQNKFNRMVIQQYIYVECTFHVEKVRFMAMKVCIFTYKIVSKVKTYYNNYLHVVTLYCFHG